jgi:cation:H+ antiporter
MSIIELLLSLAAILGAAILFTNAVEMMGERLNLGHGSVGSILAAVGTALPETMIPIVAILGAVIVGTGGEAAGEIGIGAILGAPFLLATLAFFLVGVSAIAFRGRRRTGSVITTTNQTFTDIVFFLICFGLATGAGVIRLPFLLKIILGLLLLVAYVLYVIRTIRQGGAAGEGDEGEAPSNLTLWPFRSTAPTWAVATQLIGMVVVMGFAAHFFVDAVGHISHAIGIPAGLISLVLAPLATELPEKFNSIIWMREGKDTLALGNITGAMVFQSTIPVTVGMLFTPWDLGFLGAFSAVLALASGVVFIGFLVRKAALTGFVMLGAGSLYVVFLVAATIVVVGS